MANKMRALISRIGYTTASFVLALSTLTAAVPFILSERVGAVAVVSDGGLTHSNVTSEDELRAAIKPISEGGATTINLGASFTIDSQISINRTLTLNGGGFTISPTYTSSVNDNVIVVVAGGVLTANNLVVDGASKAGVQGIQVHYSAATLNNVTVKNNTKAGIHANNSPVTVSNVTTVNNGTNYGGIHISGTGVVTILGQSHHNETSRDIWQDTTSGSIVDDSVQYSSTAVRQFFIFGNVIGYIHTLKSAPAAPAITAPTTGATFTASNEVTVSWNKPSYASTFKYQIDGGAIVSNGTAQSITQAFANGTHTVKVWSVAASGLTSTNAASVQFTVNVYEYAASDSLYSYSERYIRQNDVGAGSSNDNVAVQVGVPVDADALRVSFNGGASWIESTDGVNSLSDDNLYKSGLQHGRQLWRIKKALPEGEYTANVEYKVFGSWYPVTGGPAKVYSLSAPVMTIQNPNDTKNVFRPNDSNIVRIKVSDKFNSFDRAEFIINGVKYTVSRGDAGVDLRQAGNYVIVDIASSPTWSALPENVYTATVNAWNKANGRASKSHVATRSFTIDATPPVVTNFTAPTLVGSSITASADATDANGIGDVRFYIAELPADGIPKNNLTGIRDAYGVNTGGDTYQATISTAGLADGEYVLLVRAKDAATHTSTPQFKVFTVDNTPPTVQIVAPTGSLFNHNVEVRGVVSDFHLRHYWLNVTHNGTTVVSSTVLSSGITSDFLLYNAVAEGTYVVTLAARDLVGGTANSGNRSSNVVKTFVIDKTAPDAPTNLVWSSTSGPVANGGITNAYSGVASWDASASSDVSHYIYQYWNDGTTYTEVSPWPATVAGVSLPGEFNQGEGTHYFNVIAVDHAGNKSNPSETFTITFDESAPGLPVILIANATGASGTAEPGSTVVVRVNGQEYTTQADQDGNWEVEFDPELSEGTYDVTVEATDDAGNTSSEASQQVIVAPAQNTGGGEELFRDLGIDPDLPAAFNQVAAQGILGLQDLNPDLTPENGEPDELGVTDNAAQAGDIDEDDAVKAATGLDWYWWVLIAAGAATILWWIIGAARRRGNNEA